MASDKDILSPAASKKNSAQGMIIGVVIATLVAVGAGAAIGMQFSAMITPPAKEKNTKDTKTEKHEPIAKNYTGNRTVKTLPIMLTNLVSPKNAWVRMEAAIIVSGEEIEVDVLAAKIAEDTMAYLRTLTLSDLEGASGLAYLRSDLNERATVRSEGKVLEFVIGSLVVE